jgi:Zn-dependent protease with chaperone function
MIIGAVVGTTTFTIVNYIMSDYNLGSIKDIFTLIISALIFFIAWTGAQYFLIRKSEKKADDEIKE